MNMNNNNAYYFKFYELIHYVPFSLGLHVSAQGIQIVDCDKVDNDINFITGLKHDNVVNVDNGLSP